MWRLGTGYTWEFSRRYILSPSADMDFIREDPGEWSRAFVFAVSVGVAF